MSTSLPRAGLIVVMVAVAVGLVVDRSPGGAAPTAEGDRRYVQAAYRVFLDRPATGTEVEDWAGRFAAGLHRSKLPNALALSDEWLGVEVTKLYRAALDRAPDAEGLAYWVAQLRRGVMVHKVGSLVYGSPEFYQRAGATPEGFVDDIYTRILGRSPDDDGRAYWLGELDRLGRGRVAAAFFASVESRTGRVEALYDRILGRAPDPDGLTYWVQQLRRVNDVRLAVLLASSTEFYERAAAPPPDLALDVDPCDASLLVALEPEQSLISEGQTTAFEANVRNQPVGPCFGTDVGPSVSGALQVAGGPGGSTVTDIAVWLSRAGEVFPTDAGLATTGTTPPEVCPGGTATGCTAAIQAQVGNVDFPGGTELTVPEGGTGTIPFRYFPTLAPGDEDTLATGAVTLHAVVHTDDGLRITFDEVDFADAPAVEDADLTVDSPVTAPATTTLGSIPPGDEVTVSGIAPYTAAAGHPDTSEFVGTAVGTARSAEVSGSGTASVAVGPDPSARPELPVTIEPAAVTTGVQTSVLVVARPPDTPDAPLGAVATVDGANRPAVALNDAGTGGDLVAQDGVHSATVALRATTSASVVVSGSIDGDAVSGGAGLSVLPAGAPLGPTTQPIGPTITRPGTDEVFAADRLTVRIDDTGTYADVQAAASAADGTVIGRVAAETWQIGVTPLASYAAFESVAATVSGVPHVIGVDLDAIAAPTVVVPNDPGFSQQWAHTRMRNDQAWIANRGGAGTVVVAVVDSGIDLDHPDLAGKIVGGYDFIDDDTSPGDASAPGTFSYGHGTHVAGIIGARSHNGTGVTGTSWGARIMPIRVCVGNQGCTYSDIAAGIRHAVARGAQVISLSLQRGNRNEAVAEALHDAWLANVVVVAAAGNDATSARSYPAAYERSERFTSWFGLSSRTYTTDVIAVGSTNESDGRSSFSNYGGWVDVAAPGSNIYSTMLNDTYLSMNGTSMAAPYVAGVAALLRHQEPGLPTELVRRRLIGTGKKIGNLQIGRRVDTYEATFNGSFEMSSLETWQHNGDAQTVTRLGPIAPLEGSRMAWIGTGPGSSGVSARLVKRITVDPAAIQGGNVTLSFSYNYVTEEYPEYVGSQYNDYFRAEVRTPGGAVVPVAFEEVNTTAWTAISGIDFTGGDSTVGQSGWRTVSVTIPAASLQGTGTFELVISDVGDSVYDSVALIDDVELR